jgi:hypothetical protein
MGVVLLALCWYGPPMTRRRILGLLSVFHVSSNSSGCIKAAQRRCPICRRYISLDLLDRFVEHGIAGICSTGAGLSV